MSTEADYSVVEAPEARPTMSWIPIAIAMVSGLIVVLLLGSIMLTPSKGGTTDANGAVISNGGSHPVGDSGSAPAEGIKVGATAPDFTLDRLGGGQITLSAFRGRPVWVNFWATWCPHCKVEMPQMKQLYEQHKADNMEIIGVDDAEPASWVDPFVKTGGYTWPVAMDVNGTVSRQYRVTGLPTHLFIGPNGVIKYIVIGELDQATMLKAVGVLLGTQ